MKVNNNLIVVRMKNPHPKKHPGPWFQFGPPGNLTGTAHYTMLPSYIGGEEYAKVHYHFKCTSCRPFTMIVGGPVAASLGVPDGTRWSFPEKIS